ncbi:argininosuccinate synthase [Candidatus Vidania fulgoroideorum]
MIIKKIGKFSKLGMSYSGGLDTTVAINWLCKKNILVNAYFAVVEKLDEKKIKKIKKKAFKVGAKKFIFINLKKKIIKEALNVIKTGAFSVYNGNYKYYNTTPIGRIVISKYLSKRMIKDKIKVWSDGSTFKGNDIERFFIYVKRIEPSIYIYKPWLDKKFIKEIGGGRKQMKEYIKKYNINFDKNLYSIDSNIIGRTYEGGKIENLNSDITEVKYKYFKKNFKKKSKTFKIHFERGIPIKFNNKYIKNYSKFLEKLNIIGGKYSLGVSDQIEDRIIGTKSRGIYESPGIYIIHNLYERLISCIHNRESINLYRENGLKLGCLLYNGNWYNDESIMRRNLISYFSNKITGYVSFKLINGLIIIEDTFSKNSKYLKNEVSMEKTKQKFNFSDRIGSLNMLNI